jgi:hypothetical protein
MNLHDNKADTATSCHQLACIYRGQMRGLTDTMGTVYSVAPEIMQDPVFMSGIILMPYFAGVLL